MEPTEIERVRASSSPTRTSSGMSRHASEDRDPIILNTFPEMRRALSDPVAVFPLCNSSLITAGHKAAFRIALPARLLPSTSLPTYNPLCIPRTPVSGGRPSDTSFADTLFSVLRGNALLTPPDEIPQPFLESNTMDASSEPIPEASDAPSDHAASYDPRPSITVTHPSSNSTNQQESNYYPDDPTWLAEPLEIAFRGFPTRFGAVAGKDVHVVSQALPFPSRNVDSAPFQSMHYLATTAIQSQTQTNPDINIYVTHAVPQDYPIRDMPTSPPVTPSRAGGVMEESAGDYFTNNPGNIFDMAMPIGHKSTGFGSNNAEDMTFQSLALRLRPQSSVDVSLVERIIPPSSAKEYREIFSSTGQSLIRSRINELQKEGTLIFAYPTKTGGEIFMDSYLGPIQDPLLRTMVHVYNLTIDLAEDLGNMNVIDTLPEFGEMERKFKNILKSMDGKPNKEGDPMSFELIWSGTDKVKLERRTWTDWYIKQETPRIKEITSKYFQRARRLPTNQHVTYATLNRELLDGIKSRPYAEGAGPGDEDGIEVGVFVVRRRA
ncbi:hypothetical protein MMC25_006057 [Agyrium rufum]|nr:hypothetical protein [Agyrium rufum]